jgi:hypothetical protein
MPSAATRHWRVNLRRNPTVEIPPSRSLPALEMTLEMLFPEEPELFNPPQAG